MDKVADPQDIETDGVMFTAGAAFDVAAIGAGQQPWRNRTLCQVNDAAVRRGVLDGDFHSH